MNLPLDGFKIIESEFLTEPGDPVEVRRSWHERLFTRPWRPLQTTRTVIPQVPSKTAFRIGLDTIVMHPVAVRMLKSELEEYWKRGGG